MVVVAVPGVEAVAVGSWWLVPGRGDRFGTRLGTGNCSCFLGLAAATAIVNLICSKTNV